MSPGGVHFPEMSMFPDDETGEPSLPAGFVDDLRLITSGPAPEPRPGLLAVMAGGAPAPGATPARRRPLIGRALVGGLAARVALGMGVAAASVTAAGAAGVLPEPAQHAVAAAVSAATPFHLPDPATAPAVTTPGGTTAGGGAGRQASISTVPGTTAPLAGGPGVTTGGDNHGGCVSAVATEGTESGNHGQAVSSAARSDCGRTTTTAAATTSTTRSTVAGGNGTRGTTTTVDDANRGKGSDGKGTDGNGSGNGSGHGNGGSGNGAAPTTPTTRD